jgi:transcription elongation factor GreA
MAETKLSRAAFERLQAELDDLTTRGRIDIAATIQRARELGDLKENADYHAARDDQGRMVTRGTAPSSPARSCRCATPATTRWSASSWAQSRSAATTCP